MVPDEFLALIQQLSDEDAELIESDPLPETELEIELFEMLQPPIFAEIDSSEFTDNLSAVTAPADIFSEVTDPAAN